MVQNWLDTEDGWIVKKLPMKKCNCNYNLCSRKGIGCEFISHHLGNRELPRAVLLVLSKGPTADPLNLSLIWLHQAGSK